MTNKINVSCKKCGQGVMAPIERSETFHPPGCGEVVVDTLAAKCSHCGIERVLPSQMDENLARLGARKSKYGGHLLGEEILAFRRAYGLSQQVASKIFGKGKIAFSRYENEDTYPDASTRLLIQLAMERADVLKILADKAGVEIPLWQKRLQDEQRIKVRPFVVRADEPTSVVVLQDLTYKADAAISPHVNYVYHPKTWRRASRAGAGSSSPSQMRDIEVAV